MNAVYSRNLVLEGYTVTAKRSRLFVFLVIKPCGKVYEVNPVENTCTCRAGELGKKCCHRTQLQSLLRHYSRHLLALSAELHTTDFPQSLALLAEVEELVAQWKDVREAQSHIPQPNNRPVPVSTVNSVEAFHAHPSRFAIWGQNSRNRAWICLGKQFRSFEQAENVRATVYAPSARYVQTSVRPFHAVAA